MGLYITYLLKYKPYLSRKFVSEPVYPMKINIIFCTPIVTFFVLICISSKAQTKKEVSDYPYYIQMMQDTAANYFDVQNAFNKYYAKHAPLKSDKDGDDNDEDESYNLYKRWEYNMLPKINPDGTRIPGGQVMKEYLNFINTPSFTTFGTQSYSPNPLGNWKLLGPAKLPVNTTGYEVCGMGRINAIAFDPRDTGKYYIGAPAGGLWVTTNSGKKWACLTDALPTLGVSAIAIDPNADSILYIGTGDRDHNDAPGLGVMKSTNGGQTWMSINANMGNFTVSKMLISPANSHIIIAATSAGIFRSANGGSSWVKASPNSDYYKDLVFKPHHPNVMYAESGSRFYRSTDSGKSFIRNYSLDSNYRGVIGVSPADSNYVYFILAGTYAFDACYLSTDGGGTFSQQSNSPNILDWSDDGSGTRGQAFYDLCISVDTADKTNIYVGGVNVFQSTNSGKDWNVIAHWTSNYKDSTLPVIHADQHIMAINPLNNKMYEGNDGGIYCTPDGGATWHDVTGNVAISQIYKIAQSAVRPDLEMIGCQDNATSILSKGNWVNVIGGDGTGVAMDTKDTMYNYGCYVYGDLYQTTNAGKTYNQIGGYSKNGINDSGQWVIPYALCKKNNNTMFAGYHNLYMCNVLKSGFPFWVPVTSNAGPSSNYTINAIDQSDADTNVFYMARTDKKLLRTANLLSPTGPAWKDITSSLPSQGTVTDIKTHPKYASAVYIIQNQKIYLSLNDGGTWKNITGNLPNIPLNCLLLDSNANTGIYVGTSAGIYYKDSTMANWILYSAHLPVAVEAKDMKIYYDTNNTSNNTLSAATFGRGAWQSPLYSGNVAGFTASDTFVCPHATISFKDTTGGAPFAWKWEILPARGVSFINGSNSGSQNPVMKFDSAGYFTIKLKTTTLASLNIKTLTNFIHVAAPGASSAGVLNATICKGDVTKLYIKGATGYSWTSTPPGFTSTVSNPFVSPAATTTYYVSATNVCGNVSDSVIVKVNPAPDARWADSINNSTVAFAPKSSGAAYHWYFGDSLARPAASDSSSLKSPVHIYHAVGTYKTRLLLTNNFNCTSEYDSELVISSLTGISQPGAGLFNLTISPNPFTSAMTISYTLPQSQQVQLILTDVTGKQIATITNGNQNSGQHTLTLDAAKYNMPEGIYFLRMVAGSEAVVEKLIRIQ